MARGKQLAVVAIGGNALVRGQGLASAADEVAAARELAAALRQLLERGWRLLVTHGNGPQVGLIWRRSELAAQMAPELPRLGLDVCGAQSQGGLGYLLVSTLGSELRRARRPEEVAGVITHTVVARADPAFANPAKPIGAFYPDQEAARLAETNGWDMAEDSGRGWRRVVPSPRPLRVVEEHAVAALLAASFVVVAAGGGGIPVVEEADGGYRGVEAVIDKDRTAALLARAIGADLLVITTAGGAGGSGLRQAIPAVPGRALGGGSAGIAGRGAVSARQYGPESGGGDRVRRGRRADADHLTRAARRRAGREDRHPHQVIRGPAVATRTVPQSDARQRFRPGCCGQLLDSIGRVRSAAAQCQPGHERLPGCVPERTKRRRVTRRHERVRRSWQFPCGCVP